MLTKAEAAWIAEWAQADWSQNQVAPAGSLLTKLRAAEAPKRGAAVGPIEEALIRGAGGKVAPLVTGHAQASRRCLTAGVTPEQAQMVGEWMARQGWLVGPQTLLDVLNKWPSWLSKAAATEPPPGLKPGLGSASEAGRSTATTGQRAPGRSTPRGFR